MTKKTGRQAVLGILKMKLARERELKPRPIPAYQARNSTDANRRLCRRAHGHSIQPSGLIAGFMKPINQGGLATVDRNDPNDGGLIIAKARGRKVGPYLL